jgi:ERCC4-type nuclease
MPIWLDYRERGLQALAPTLQMITPPVGDIWIGDMSGNLLQEGGVILERKSLNDLEASVIDGRYEEQRGRMLAYANEQKVAIGYVIEGQTKGFQGRRFTGDSVLKLISQIQFKHRIPVFQTDSTEDTLALAVIIEGEWAKAKGNFSWQMGAGNSSTPIAASYTKSNSRDTPDSFLIGVLTQCRGVSEGLARIILDKVKTLEGLLATTEADIAAIADGKRKVGKAVAARLYGLLHLKAENPSQHSSSSGGLPSLS